MILNEEDEADTVYLLAKELAYDVVTGQTDKLTAALAGYRGEDIVRFADALGISHSKIDDKICRTKKGHESQPTSHGIYARETNAKDDSGRKGETALCGGHGSTTSGSAQTPPQSDPQVFRHFVAKTLKGEKGEIKNWPTSSSTNDAVEKKKTNDNAEAVAKDLVNLNRDEKTIVAGLLAKTIEGGEVVEIRAVSSTSVMVNACYDLLSEGLGVVPYACVGLGGNFVGVVDEYSTIRL
ncbi:Major surface antigen 4 precursor [Anaplasma phagocytophilum]|uniref:Major surface antigen 4 n=1 Tax=Anaplasma phagocytophilum TaxID=948 RepID=A0AA45UTB0_ANAPH|nr:Major surface antigen 4 precursor [Anaplasma phagocytophilum]